jgi:hypothetical protein
MAKITRRQLVATGATAAVAGAIAAPAMVLAQNRPVPGTHIVWLERFDVVVNRAGADFLRAPSGTTLQRGPFYGTGTLYPEGTVGAAGTPSAGAVGTYKVSGWIYDPIPPNFVGTHVFNLFGMGQITAAGTTEVSVPVVGGTGNFKSARGEVRAAFMTMDRLSIEVELIAPTTGK